MSTEVTVSGGQETETEAMGREMFRFSSSGLLERTEAPPRAGCEPLDLSSGLGFEKLSSHPPESVVRK